MKLAPSRTCVVEQVAEFAGVWFDFLYILLEPGIAFEHQYLMLRSTFLAYSVHLSVQPRGKGWKIGRVQM